MIRNKESGQALILALILFAIGALMVVPSLRLMDTSLKSHEIVASQQRGFYVAEAAQQKVQWMLLRDNLTESFTKDGDTVNLSVNVCDYVADVTVVMRATEGEGGIILALDDTIMPTKTVYPDIIAPPDDYKDPRYFYYEISLKQVSCDNTRDLVGIWDILPPEFDFADDIYVPGSSEISIDGGEWQQIGDPLLEEFNQPRFHWPGPGDSFTPDFTHFEPGQVNKLRFQIYSDIQTNDVVLCNWVVLKVGDSYTLSGPQAPINVGSPEVCDACETNGMFKVDKTADPLIVSPLTPTDVTYTITINNMDGNTRSFMYIDDYLPPGFEYLGPTSGVIVLDPHSETVTLNGVERQHLWWNQAQLGSSGIELVAGESATITFIVTALQSVSGTYYNEVTVKPKSAPTPPTAFTTIDEDYDWENAFVQAYSWNSGTVIIPAYETESEADGEIIDANYGLSPEGVTVNSWHVR